LLSYSEITRTHLITLPHQNESQSLIIFCPLALALRTLSLDKIPEESKSHHPVETKPRALSRDKFDDPPSTSASSSAATSPSRSISGTRSLLGKPIPEDPGLSKDKSPSVSGSGVGSRTQSRDKMPEDARPNPSGSPRAASRDRFPETLAGAPASPSTPSSGQPPPLGSHGAASKLGGSRMKKRLISWQQCDGATEAAAVVADEFRLYFGACDQELGALCFFFCFPFFFP
jgi:hypothetical protein